MISGFNHVDLGTVEVLGPDNEPVKFSESISKKLTEYFLNRKLIYASIKIRVTLDVAVVFDITQILSPYEFINSEESMYIYILRVGDITSTITSYDLVDWYFQWGQ